MKALRLIIILTLLVSCTKKSDDPIIVTSLDQIAGIWKWESTCGGLINTCGYSSRSHYGQIEFATDNQFIESYNDTVYFAAQYEIKKSDDHYGTLVLRKMGSDVVLSDRPISILDNKLMITGGELLFTYKKTK